MCVCGIWCGRDFLIFIFVESLCEEVRVLCSWWCLRTYVWCVVRGGQFALYVVRVCMRERLRGEISLCVFIFM